MWFGWAIPGYVLMKYYRFMVKEFPTLQIILYTLNQLLRADLSLDDGLVFNDFTGQF